MKEEIAFVNGQICDFEGLVTLTLDQVILHTVMHHSSTSTYTPNFIENEKLFVDRLTDVRRGIWTFETHFIRSTWRSRPKDTEWDCGRLIGWQIISDTFFLAKHLSQH